MLADGTPAEIAENPRRAGSLSGESRMNALTAEGLNTYYGKSHILHDVSLTVAEGRITTLLGRNGAGKTTTLRSLVGLTPARIGQGDAVRPGHHRPAAVPHRGTRRRLCARKAGASSPT